MVIVVMGVSGTGKSTIGKLLAQRLLIPFLDADDFHPEANIIKMSNGIALNDADRAPWLAAVSTALQQYESSDVVLACSALKEAYRKALEKGSEGNVVWFYLQGSKETILERIKSRGGHFMPAALLQSQLDTWEKPDYAYCFSIDKAPEIIVTEMIGTIERLK